MKKEHVVLSVASTMTLEREQFDEFMVRNQARLLDFAKPYIGSLVLDQREEFLKFALERAWETRAQLKPRKSAFAEANIDILRWWEDNCLIPAARSRDQWLLRTWDRRTEIVSGRRLGRQGIV